MFITHYPWHSHALTRLYALGLIDSLPFVQFTQAFASFHIPGLNRPFTPLHIKHYLALILTLPPWYASTALIVPCIAVTCPSSDHSCCGESHRISESDLIAAFIWDCDDAATIVVLGLLLSISFPPLSSWIPLFSC